ncbi:iron(III) transport system permease protein [Phyllobacterium trifolii]|uniref:Iron(III) transport system permease protein n=1 Tax=Phyllobacterium trifolii TaxID=300193 RepID=A0A839UD88_9HYPH|nr:iron ABC transporter permease [Phyllobacterium trifolii]MBB3146890.1 iron(III) transport system permease protein [Phyllobacterium trifolii]
MQILGNDGDPSGLTTRLPVGMIAGSRSLRSIIIQIPNIVRWTLAVLLFALLVSPMLPIAYQAFSDKPLYESNSSLTLANFRTLFDDPRFHAASIATFWFALIATAISTFVGFLAALILERLDIPFRRTLKILFLSPIFVSALILAFAWSMLFGPSGYATIFLRAILGVSLPNLNSIGGMGLLAGVTAAPVSYLFFSSAIANIPPTLESAARAAGAAPFSALMTIVLPLLRPSLLYCVLLNFVMAIDHLAVPLIFGEPARIEVLSTYLYERGVATQADYGLVSAAALVMLAMIQIVILAQKSLLGDVRRYTTVGGRSVRRGLVPLGRTGWIISAAFLTYTLLTTGIPSAFLILRSFCSFMSPLIPIHSVLTLENFKLILGYDAYVQSIVNTLIVATVGGFVAMLLTFALAIVAYRSSTRLRRFVEFTAFIPRAIPGIVVGIGIFYAAVLLPGGGYIRGTLAILMIAFTIRYFPTGFAVLTPAYLQLGEDLERAVRVAGGGELRSIWAVTLPLLRSAMVGCFLLYFVQFFKEYAAASFLFGPDTAVIGTTMLQLDLMGNLGPVAALSVITLVLTLPIAIFIYAKD